MKCSKCGHWNQPSFPRCFQCGAPLTPSSEPPAWKEKFSKPKPARVRKVYDDAAPPEDPIVPVEIPGMGQASGEALATEMNRLKERRARGAAYLEQFRKQAAEEGIAPSGAQVTIERGDGFFDSLPDDPQETLYEPPVIQKRVRAYDDTLTDTPLGNTLDEVLWEDKGYVPVDEAVSQATADDLPPAFDLPPVLPPPLHKKKRSRRTYGPMAAAIWLVRILVACAIAFVLWQGSLLLSNFRTNTKTVDAQFTVAECEIDGYPGHHIEIVGEEGTQIYIAELTRSYVVIGGVATIRTPDYVFYDDIENLDVSSMSITLTPSVITPGKECALSPISFDVDIPLSRVEMISPESNWVEVNTSIYSLAFVVEPQSHVTINGVDVSDTIDDDGNVTYNPSIQAIGENVVGITVRAPHCRENNFTLTFYRKPMDISLELAADTQLSTSSKYMTIFAYTEPNATVTIESPHANLDVTNVAANGSFSFDAEMSRVGYNTITIRVSIPGREDSVLEHTVYYLPPASVYTPKAWALTRSDYSELLNNISMRTQVAQIYLCQGEIVEILADNPQLAIMDTSTDGAQQLVMLQNESSAVWEVGKKYRIYADVSGMYNMMPRLIARYTYSE